MRHERDRLETDLDQSRDETVISETATADLRAEPDALHASQSRFELYEDAAEEWRWRLLHRNGNIIADSGEDHTRHNDANRAVDRIQERIDTLEFGVHEDATGEGYTDRSSGDPDAEPSASSPRISGADPSSGMLSWYLRFAHREHVSTPACCQASRWRRADPEMPRENRRAAGI